MATRRPAVNVEIRGDSAGLDRAVARARGSINQLGRSLSGVQALASRALNFAGIAGGASAAGLIALATTAANTANEMGKMAQRVGLTAEEVSRLAYTADQGDASLSALEGSLRRLSRNLDDASRGGAGAIETFERLDIPVRDANGELRGTVDVLHDVAEVFGNMADGPEKTALAFQLFGRAGTELIPMLNGGRQGMADMAAEADRLGRTISNEAAEAGAAFNDDLLRLQTLSKGLAQEVGMALVPSMHALAAAFLDAATEQREITGESSLVPWAEAAVKSVAFLVDVLDGFWRVVKIIGTGIGGYLAMATSALRGNLAEARSIYNELNEDIDKILLDPFFSDRLKARMAPDAREAQSSADARLRIEKQLNAEILKLAQLRTTAARTATDEEIKGAQKLAEELRKAWQESVNGAKAAREESAALLQQAAEARQSGIDRAEQRRMRGMSEAERDAYAYERATRLRDEAARAASAALVAGWDGDLEAANRLAAEAARSAERAQGFVDSIADDGTAVRLFEELGQIQAKALTAQARVKEREARSLEELAQQQAEQLASAEERLAELKAALEEPVTIELDIMDAESKIAALKKQLDELAAPRTAKITPVSEPYVFDNQGWEPVGYARGGYTGPGGKYQPAGIVHKGEFVLPQEIVRRPGALAALNAMLRDGVPPLPGYSAGGLVSRIPIGSLPSSSNASASSTPLVLDFGQLGQFEARANAEVTDDLARAFRRAVLQRGRRK